MITVADVFNEDSINIFTDASMTALKNEVIGCSGCCTVLSLNEYITKYRINRDSTNNNSEAKAIRLAVYEALKYKDKTIRIFSDSQISIFGIRDRIFNWKITNKRFYGTSGEEIKNQEIFAEIVNLIMETGMKIEFYHQKGHVNNNIQSLTHAKKVFQASNNIRDDISIDLIKLLSDYNNLVDRESRQILFNTDLNRTRKERELISFYCNPDWDKAKYYNLIH